MYGPDGPLTPIHEMFISGNRHRCSEFSVGFRAKSETKREKRTDAVERSERDLVSIQRRIWPREHGVAFQVDEEIDTSEDCRIDTNLLN